MVCLGTISCNSVESIPPRQISNKTVFQWSRDSIDYQGRDGELSINAIWGAHPNDLWGVAGTASDIRDQLWHFDGACWKRATDQSLFTDGSGYHLVNSIYGTSAQDIWAVGATLRGERSVGFIMHYNGSQWSDVTPDTISKLQTEFYNISIKNDNDIWIMGYQYVAHYNGSQWKPYKIADSLIVRNIISFQNDFLISAYSPWGGLTLYLMRWKIGETPTSLDHTNETTQKFLDVFDVSENIIWSYGRWITSTEILSSGMIDTANWVHQWNSTYPLSNYYKTSFGAFYFTGQNGQIVNLYHGIIQVVSVDKISNPRFEWFRGVWTDGEQIVVCDIENKIMSSTRKCNALKELVKLEYGTTQMLQPDNA